MKLSCSDKSFFLLSKQWPLKRQLKCLSATFRDTFFKGNNRGQNFVSLSYWNFTSRHKFSCVCSWKSICIKYRDSFREKQNLQLTYSPIADKTVLWSDIGLKYVQTKHVSKTSSLTVLAKNRDSISFFTPLRACSTKRKFISDKSLYCFGPVASIY